MASESANQQNNGDLSNDLTIPKRPGSERDWLIEAFLHIGRSLSDDVYCVNFEKYWPVLPEKLPEEIRDKLKYYQTKVIDSWIPYWEWFIGQELTRICNGITQLHKLIKSDGTKKLRGIDESTVPSSHRRYVEMMKNLWDEIGDTHSGNRENCTAPEDARNLQLQSKCDTDRLKIDVEYRPGKGTKKETPILNTIMEHLIRVLEGKSASCPEPWPDTETEDLKNQKAKKRLEQLKTIMQENWGLTWKCYIGEDIKGQELKLLLEHLENVHRSYLLCGIRTLNEKARRNLKTHTEKLIEISSKVQKKILTEAVKGRKAVKKPDKQNDDIFLQFHESLITEITEMLTQNSFNESKLPYPPDGVVGDAKAELLQERESLGELLQHHWTNHHQDACCTQQAKFLPQFNENEAQKIDKRHESDIYGECLDHLVNVLKVEYLSFKEFPLLQLDSQTDRACLEICESFKQAVREHWEQYHSPNRFQGKLQEIECERQFLKDLFEVTFKVYKEGGEQISCPEIPDTLPREKQSELSGVFEKMQQLFITNRETDALQEMKKEIQFYEDLCKTTIKAYHKGDFKIPMPQIPETHPLEKRSKLSDTFREMKDLLQATRCTDTLQEIKTEKQFYRELCEATIKGCRTGDYIIPKPQLPVTYAEDRRAELSVTFQKMKSSLQSTGKKMKELQTSKEEFDTSNKKYKETLQDIETERQFYKDLCDTTINGCRNGDYTFSLPQVPETYPMDKWSGLNNTYKEMKKLLQATRRKIKEHEEKPQKSDEGSDASKKKYTDTRLEIETERQFYKHLCEATVKGCREKDYNISEPQIPEMYPPDKRSGLTHTYKEIKNSLTSVRTEMKDRIHDLRLKLKKSDDECGTLRTRLSEMAGAKLTRGNSAITDLSDPNRPTKISEKFSELYDNEWTDALEELGNPEKKAICDLLLGLQECFVFCIDEQKEMWSKLGKTYTGKKGDFGKLAEEQEWTGVELKKLHEAHKIWMKAAFGKAVKKFMKGVDESKSAERYRTYMQKCLDLCWLMRMQDPPMCIDFDFKKGKPFDKNILRFFTKTGEKIDYLVWPVLRIHEKGDPLGKGVAQPL